MVANKVQRRDKGIDGKGWLLHPVKEKGKKNHLILAPVKAGKPTLSQVRDFAHVISTTEGAVAGVFITVEKAGKKGHWTDGMREVAPTFGRGERNELRIRYKRTGDNHWLARANRLGRVMCGAIIIGFLVGAIAVALGFPVWAILIIWLLMVIIGKLDNLSE